MNTKRQELGPYEPVSDQLVLAAIERAARQGAAIVWAVHVAEDLGFLRQAHTTRKVREQLEGMRVRDGTVERLDRRGRDYWQLTAVGERALAEARAEDRLEELPESPQHRAWRKAHEAAAERIEGFRVLLNRATDAVSIAEEQADAPSSGEWLELGERVRAAAWLVASATYCLHEWPEPGEDGLDVNSDPRRGVWAWDRYEATANGEDR